MEHAASTPRRRLRAATAAAVLGLAESLGSMLVGRLLKQARRRPLLQLVLLVLLMVLVLLGTRVHRGAESGE